MLMKPNGYDQAEAYYQEGMGSLPAGGYVCKIMNLHYEKTQTGKDIILVSLDVAEGEYAGFYLKRYNRAKQDTSKQAKWGCQWRIFLELPQGGTNGLYKGFMTAYEKSNGVQVNWMGDEKQFTGKLVGVLFRDEEFLGADGKMHHSTKPCAVRTADAIRSGEFQIPAARKQESRGEAYDSDIPTDQASGYAVAENEELPF